MLLAPFRFSDVRGCQSALPTVLPFHSRGAYNGRTGTIAELPRILLNQIFERQHSMIQESLHASQIVTAAPIYDRILWSLVVIIILVGLWRLVRKNPKHTFWYVVGVLFLAGILLLLIQVPSINADFSRALGHAFIIASILAATVDHYLKERVLREVTLDVSKYLIGYRLPQEVQDRIRDLLQSKWIRRRFDLRIAFNELAGGKKTKVDIRISEELQNITSETLPYHDVLEFDQHEPFTVLEMRCDCEEADCGYFLEGGQLNAIRTEANGVISFKTQEVRVPPVANTLNAYRFGARYELTQPTKFSELISFSIPTIGVSIEITDHPPHYKFHVSPLPDVQAHNRWEYRRLFLPGEHIKIIWEREAG